MHADTHDSVLAECLTLLESGLSVADCCERFPEVEGLADLLFLAVALRSAAHPEPDPVWFAASRRRLEQLAERKSETLLSAANPAAALVWAWRWSLTSNAAFAPALVALRVAALIAVLALAGSVTVDAALASTRSLPFLSLKSAAEEARMAATFDPATRALLHLQRAALRVEELAAAPDEPGAMPSATLAAAIQADVLAALSDLELAVPQRRSAALAMIAQLAVRNVTFSGAIDHAVDGLLTIQGARVALPSSAGDGLPLTSGTRVTISASLGADGIYHAHRVAPLAAVDPPPYRSQLPFPVGSPPLAAVRWSSAPELPDAIE